MFEVNDLIKQRKFGTPKMVTEVSEHGVFCVNIRITGDQLWVISETLFIPNEDLGRFHKFKSMKLSPGTIGSAWN